jgi:hypothetical protein
VTDQVELRLRHALHARAGQITQERLSPGVPPTVAAPRPPLRWWRWLPVPAGAVIAAVALGLALAPGSTRPDPAPPGGPVIVTPSATSTEPPAPSAATTDPGPAVSSPESVTSTPSRSVKPKAVTAVPASPRDTKAPAAPEATPGS